MKAVIYARKSPHRRPKPGEKGEPVQESESIQWQHERLAAFCTALDYEIVGQHEDWFKSGKTTKGRDGLEAAISQAIKVRGVLCVYDFSRLSRDPGDGLAIVRRLRKGKAELRSIVDGVATDTADGELIFTVKMSLFQYVRRVQAEKTSDAMKRHQYHDGNDRRRMGRVDRVPYGFRAVNGKGLEPDPDEQKTVARIVALAGSGLGSREIARALDGEGIPRRGKLWEGAHGLVVNILSRQ